MRSILIISITVITLLGAIDCQPSWSQVYNTPPSSGLPPGRTGNGSR